MKIRNINPGILLFAVLSILLFARVECDPDPDPTPANEKCGKLVPGSYVIEHDNLTPAAHFSGVNQDGKAVYQYTAPTVTKVCIEEHVNYKVIIYTPDIALGSGTFTGEFMYGLLSKYYFGKFEYDYNSVFNYPFYRYYGDAGLKDSVHDPAWFIMTLNISFDDKGSTQANHDYLLYLVEFIQFDYDYYEPKVEDQ